MLTAQESREAWECRLESRCINVVSSSRRRGVGRALMQDHVQDRQEGMGKERLKMALQVLF